MLYEVTDTETDRVLAVFGDPSEARRMKQVMGEATPAAASGLRVVAVNARGEPIGADDLAAGCRCCRALAR